MYRVGVAFLYYLTALVCAMSTTQDTTLKVIMKCVNFATVKHKNQRRKDPESTPYINHPIGVAHILTNEALVNDVVVVQAAILHDTVEDTDTSLEEIEREFGSIVRAIVAEVTDDKSLPKARRKQLQIERAPTLSPQAKLVALADKLYNLRDLDRVTPKEWSNERVQEYFQWSKKVVKELSGTNSAMEKSLNELFTKWCI